jgi:hypothetical protein
MTHVSHFRGGLGSTHDMGTGKWDGEGGTSGNKKGKRFRRNLGFGFLLSPSAQVFLLHLSRAQSFPMGLLTLV